MRAPGWALCAALVALPAGCFGAACPGDWYAEEVLYLDHHRVNLSDPQYYLEGAQDGASPNMTEAAHMHRTLPGEWHFQGGCTSFAAANALLDIHVTGGALLLTGAHENIRLAGTHAVQGGTYPFGPGHSLAAFDQFVWDPWSPVNVSALMARQIHNGEKVLLLYGNYSTADVQAYESAVPDPPDFARAYQETYQEPPQYPAP
ncbi:MAG: hypothetical protein ACYDBQ_09935 [Thermoplasmatota archaeon]